MSGRGRRIRRGILRVALVLALAPVPALLVLRVVNPPASAFMTLTAKRLRARGAGPVTHRWVGLDRIAHCMPLAAVASEDQTFPTNHGLVWSAILRAIRHNMAGGRVEGASTITQQTVKNLFLWPAREYTRKAIEAYVTLWMDLLWSKRRIMTVYLNVAQFSRNAFGVSAAARTLFHTRAADLSRLQCAALAAVLPAPDAHDAARPDAFVRHRTAWILEQMRHLGPDYLDGVLGAR